MGLIIDRPEEVGGKAEVLQRKFEKQLFSHHVLFELFSNGNIINRAVLDGMLEGGRIEGQARYRRFIDSTASS